MKSQEKKLNQADSIAQAFSSRVTQQLRETLALELQILELRNLQTTQAVGLLQNRLREQGHLNAIDTRTNEVLRDAFNMPIQLELPRPDKPRVELIGKLLSDLLELLKESENSNEDNKAIDVRNYEHLFQQSDA